MEEKNSMIEWILSLDIVSPNQSSSEHWSKRSRRNKRNCVILLSMWRKELFKPQLPVEITLTRIAPRVYDYDNLVSSFKGIRDAIAALLIPGKAAGRADDSDQITWKYEQEKGKVKQVKIRIQ